PGHHWTPARIAGSSSQLRQLRGHKWPLIARCQKWPRDASPCQTTYQLMLTKLVGKRTWPRGDAVATLQFGHAEKNDTSRNHVKAYGQMATFMMFEKAAICGRAKIANETIKDCHVGIGTKR